MNPPTADDTWGSTRGSEGHPTAGATPATASAARDRVADLLLRAGIGLDGVTAADALLITSELVTNAIRHGGGITAFHGDITDDVLHLSVSDTNPRHPVARTGTPDHPGGYGWPLIRQLAEHVEIHSHPDGKTITTALRLL
ncbi:ATP-binding protein [Streptomyces sp. NPDC006512]|uniref:ATP-binding protein n=1 Tax=Streptomyces sp. NPDC006512 TaxID=3154307 RepID=UPI0033A9E278